jgi:hypothetical protein
MKMLRASTIRRGGRKRKMSDGDHVRLERPGELMLAPM